MFCLGKTEEHRKMLVNSTGRKWEFTFTTLVTFGGAFFASFPLFYSTSFGGAYWLWMIILFSFVLQAVSYEFQSKAGNLLGKKTYRTFLVINGVVGPLLLGGAVATFFTGSDFYINKANMTDTIMPVISHWGNGWHGLDALTNIWNVILGLAVFFLARVLGALYFINNIDDKEFYARMSRKMNLDNQYNSLSDIIGGITKNQCIGRAMHRTKYWEYKGKLEREFFAHVGSALARNSKVELYNFRTIFPNSYKYFINSMKGE